MRLPKSPARPPVDVRELQQAMRQKRRARLDRMSRPGQAVFSATTVGEAEQVRAFLDAAGIPSMVRAESIVKTQGLPLHGRSGKVEVVVGEEDEERARALLAAAESGEFRLDEDADLET
jgi:hypothetical protein